MREEACLWVSTAGDGKRRVAMSNTACLHSAISTISNYLGVHPFISRMFCNVTLCYVMWCAVVWCDVILCDVVLLIHVIGAIRCESVRLAHDNCDILPVVAFVRLWGASFAIFIHTLVNPPHDLLAKAKRWSTSGPRWSNVHVHSVRMMRSSVHVHKRCCALHLAINRRCNVVMVPWVALGCKRLLWWRQ